jgi:hypothetical protein
MKTNILFLFVFLFSASVFAQNGTIKGRVFNHKNNEPVPFTNIIIDGKPNEGTTSDIDGNFTLNNVQPGYVKIIASSVGFKKYISESFLVTRSHPVTVEIPLDELVVTLESVEIKPELFVKNEESPLSVQTLGVQDIEKSPGSNRDVSKVIQTLPGVSTGVSFRNDIIIRGGGPSENRFFLDGVEIPYLNHFATQGASGGAVGIINVDFIREINLYTGAFKASRGNALSSVMELNQIDGNRDKFGARLTLGSSDLALTVNGPVSKNSSLIFSVRRSYLQLLFSLIKLPFLPTYNDYQFKYKIDLDKNNQLSVISIGALDNNKLNTGIANPDDFQKYILGNIPTNDQWSYAFGLVYKHFRPKGYGTWILSRNMLNNVQNKYRKNIEEPDSLLFNYKSQEIENKFRYENVTDLVSWKIMYGGGLEYAKYNNKTFRKVFYAGQLRTLDYNSAIDMFKWHVFGQVSKAFFNQKLELSLGVRTDANNYSSNMTNMLNQISPRLSASYSIITDKLSLNFNTGRYYQLPAYTTLGFRSNSGTLVNDSLGVKYIANDQIVLGLQYKPRSSSMITVEGFYKYYMDYPCSLIDSVSLASKGADYGEIGAEPVVPTSKGRAYGFEVLYREADLFKFNIILSYTFVRSEFTDLNGDYYPSAWDNKHLFNITVGRKFKYNWEVGAKWRFAGGTPYTPYNMYESSIVSAWDAKGRGYLDYSQFNSLRLRSFNQLDLRIDKSFFFKKWSLMIYLDVQNVLNFKADSPDVLLNSQADGSVVKFIDGTGQERYELRSIPAQTGTILPAIGIMIDL